MNIKDIVKVIQTAECAQIATFGKDETEGFPEIRALLNLANPKKYPKLKDKAISVDGETLTIYFSTNTSSRKIRQIRENLAAVSEAGIHKKGIDTNVKIIIILIHFKVYHLDLQGKNNSNAIIKSGYRFCVFITS